MLNILKYFARWLLIHLEGSVSFGLNNKYKSGVLLIRMDYIGDFIIWLDSAKEYRRLYPNKKITLIANAAWADMARGLPYWDEVWPVKLRDMQCNPFYRLAFLRKICAANFEIAIQPTFSRIFMHGDSVMRATRAIHRWGSIGDTCNIKKSDKAISDRWYTRLLPASPKPMMELQRNAEFITYLADKQFKASLPTLPVIATLPKRLQLQGAYFILFPGASSHGKQWPIQCFIEAGEQLHRRYGWRAVLCGAPHERALCQAIADALPFSCLNFSGGSTLAELAELIRGAHLLIANDTSAVHIAAAVGTPAVCILGGGHFGRFMPYPVNVAGIKPVVATKTMPCFNCNWQCNQPHDPAGPMPCISGVSVALVLDSAQQALDEADNQCSHF
jgi:ADP-heptose:LPS heptosyltransferase